MYSCIGGFCLLVFSVYFGEAFQDQDRDAKGETAKYPTPSFSRQSTVHSAIKGEINFVSDHF